MVQTFIFVDICMSVAEKNLILQQKIHEGFKVFYILDEEIRANPVLVDKKRERIFSPLTNHLAVVLTTCVGTGGGKNCLVLN
jgi:hypothetical protein